MSYKTSPYKSRRIEIIECEIPNVESQELIIENMTGEEQIITQKRMLQSNKNISIHAKAIAKVSDQNKTGHYTSNNYIISNGRTVGSEISLKSSFITATAYQHRYVNAMVTSERTKDSILFPGPNQQKLKFSSPNVNLSQSKQFVTGSIINKEKDNVEDNLLDSSGDSNIYLMN